MPNLKLYDVDTKVVYTLEVSEEDATRANEDMSFATQLLQNYLTTVTEEETKSVKETASSTSLCDDTSVVTEQKFQVTTDYSSEKDGFRWSHDAILAFLEVYKEHEHLITSGSTMKKFWNVIATELNNKGYNLTDSQCKSKMAGLRNTYTSIKDYNGKHSYCNRRWRYFDIMDEMYKKKPWISAVLKTNNSVSTPSLSEPNVDEEKTSTPSSKIELPSKRLRQLEKIIAVVEESTTERRRMHREAMTRQDKLLDILEKINNNVDDDRSGSPSCKIALPLKRSKQFSTTEKLITAIEESTIKRSKMHDEAMARQDKLLDILEKMLDNYKHAKDVIHRVRSKTLRSASKRFKNGQFISLKIPIDRSRSAPKCLGPHSKRLIMNLFL